MTALAIAALLGVGSAVLNLPSSIDNALPFGYGAYIAVRTNILYYGHRVHGRRSWGL